MGVVSLQRILVKPQKYHLYSGSLTTGVSLAWAQSRFCGNCTASSCGRAALGSSPRAACVHTDQQRSLAAATAGSCAVLWCPCTAELHNAAEGKVKMRKAKYPLMISPLRFLNITFYKWLSIWERVWCKEHTHLSGRNSCCGFHAHLAHCSLRF